MANAIVRKLFHSQLLQDARIVGLAEAGATNFLCRYKYKQYCGDSPPMVTNFTLLIAQIFQD